MVPVFKGLGYGMLTVRLLVNAYYVVIQAWALFYLGVGFTDELPWGSCEQGGKSIKQKILRKNLPNSWPKPWLKARGQQDGHLLFPQIRL